MFTSMNKDEFIKILRKSDNNSLYNEKEKVMHSYNHFLFHVRE
jgi:hypothetical protein